MIKIDASAATVLVYCTACHWRTLRGTRAEAYRVGSFHQRQEHGDDPRGLRTVEELLRRHRR